MKYYVLEWSLRDDGDLETFKKLSGLTETLRLELECETEAFTPLYIGVYERGTLTPLMLFLSHEVPELDGAVDQYYEIRDANLVTIAEFIVRKGSSNDT